MPSWGAILKEINDRKQKEGVSALDLVRRKYIASQYTHSKRAVFLYATAWTSSREGVPPSLISVNDVDIQGFMECAHGVNEKQLDLILHSPGGSPAAAEACIHYLRARFDHIRAFIPQAAMSAATMMACGADEIVMGEHSSLGPIDPQLIVQTSLGSRAVPAQAILDQFEQARQECIDPKRLPVWLPMLQQYGPDLLAQSKNVLELSQQIVRTWLSTYMFKGQQDAQTKAAAIAEWLGNHGNFKIHGRYLHRDLLRERGLKITDLEDDQAQQDYILSIFHATTHTFQHTVAAKIIENHLGKAYVNMQTAAPPLAVKPPAIQLPIVTPPAAPAVPAVPEQPPFKKKPGLSV